MSGRTGAAGIAVDATSVYWTEWIDNGSLMKVSLAGGTPVALATFTNRNIPHLVAVDGQNAYWTASDGVRKTPTSGGESVLIGSKVGSRLRQQHGKLRRGITQELAGKASGPSWPTPEIQVRLH